ncbi:MAG: class I SAM-dependent methyltransferase [Gemmatimonadota bacterium]
MGGEQTAREADEPEARGRHERIQRWDERYARGEDTHGFAPAPLLAEAVVTLNAGEALDLACGAGRHALFLAERGWGVTAVDASRAGLGLLAAEATRRGLAERIEARRADLEADPPEFHLGESAWDLVCDFFFLHRDLLDRVRRAVRPGGRLVAAIHLADAEHPSGNRAFQLVPGELHGLLEGWGWDVLLSREGPSREEGHELWTAEIVARKPESAGPSAPFAPVG